MIYRPRRRGPRTENDHSLHTLAKALGWFSIGLGLAEILIPGRLSRAVGIRQQHRLLTRLLGMREIASGLGILSERRPAAWMWSRVAGDAMDLALLGSAFAGNARKQRLIAATAAVAGVTLADLFLSERLSEEEHYENGSGSGQPTQIDVTRAITIDKPPEALYEFWRNFENLPRFMAHLKSVQMADGGRSHWVARAPMNKSVEWEAEITEDQPNRRIAWRSLAGSQVENSGEVLFQPAPGNRGTVVKVTIQYQPPGGAIGAAIAKLFGEEPGEQVKDDLRCFKQLMETGVIATTRGQSAGRKHGTAKQFDHPTPRQASLGQAEPTGVFNHQS